MRLAFITAAIGIGVVILFSLYVRTAPSDPAIWHVDPRTVVDQNGGWLLRDGPGNGPAPWFPGRPAEVLAKFRDIALGRPRVSLLAGAPQDGLMTFIARSLLMGFPDYISVAAYPDGDGTRLAIYSRMRFGQSDFGVNEARVKDWLARMG